MAKGILFIVSAPSGAGKTTLVKETLRRINEQGYDLAPIITYTTRSPRPGEKNREDYHFISREEFIEKQKNDFFLETVTFEGKLYGTSRDFEFGLAEGKSYIIIVTREGAKQLKKLYKNSVTLWISVPSIEVIRERLIKRGTESLSQIEHRLLLATQDFHDEQKHALFDYHVVNEVFDQTANEICEIVRQAIIQKKEH